MSGFKSLKWVWSILFLSILSTAPLQPVSAVSEKQVNHNIHDDYDAEGSMPNPYLQTKFGHKDHLLIPVRDNDKNLTKLNFFISQNIEYGAEPLLASHTQKRYALLIPSMNNRTLIYPFHSFL